MSENVITQQSKTIETPSILTRLFTDKRFAIVWLPIRVWLGMQWVEASLHKLSDPAWMKTGVALKGFWMGATQIPAEGHPAIAYAWYRGFLQMMLNAQVYTWFAKVVAVSEMLIGIALILGVFVGLTAFFGGFMNWNFIMAGSASVNGMFFGLAVLLVLAWKIAGYFGLDYFLLPKISALWSRPRAVQE
jgi:thiosulfate dehydrogenase (quinone) large subunit